MRSTQVSESSKKIWKAVWSQTFFFGQSLKSDLDIGQFFKHFERVVGDKRYNELQCEFECAESSPLLIGVIATICQNRRSYDFWHYCYSGSELGSIMYGRSPLDKVLVGPKKYTKFVIMWFNNFVLLVGLNILNLAFELNYFD